MAEVLEYQLPNLGLLKISIYPHAKEALDIIKGGGFLEILKNNPQLGSIRTAHEGAHHTRWEYILVQLYIITKLNEKTEFDENKLEGLSNSDPIIGNHRISGADLLQTWAILLNMGHLYGTFATERGFLYRLKEDNNLRKIIIRGLSRNSKVIDLFRKIINNDYVYGVHKILSYFFLERLRRRYKDKIDLLIKILNLYNFDQSKAKDRLAKLKGYFKKIRQSAFLFLDSNYGPVPITYELSQMLLDIETYKKNIFIDEFSELQNALNNFEDLLSESFYLNKTSMHSYGNQARFTYQNLKNKGNDIYSIRDLNIFLKNTQNFELQDPMLNLHYLLRFWLDDNYNHNYQVVENFGAIELENKWNNLLPKTRCTCTVEKDTKNMMLGITLSIKNGIRNHDYAKLCMQIIQLISSLQKEYISKVPEDVNVNKVIVFEQTCKEMLYHLLNKYWENNYKMSYTFSNNYEYWALCRGTTETVLLLDDLIKFYTNQNMDRDRLNEIVTLESAIKDIGHRSSILFTTSQILIKNNRNIHVTDLDTIAILSDNSNLSILILEAKNKKNRSVREAVNKLNSTLNLLGFGPPNMPEIIEIRNRGAYSKVRLYPEGH